MKKDRRLTYFDLKNAQSFRTFDNEFFVLKGFVAVNLKTGETEKLADVYYRVRTAIGYNKQIIAKRKHKGDELNRTYSNKFFVKN